MYCTNELAGIMLEQALQLPCGAVLKNRLCKSAMTEGLADEHARAVVLLGIPFPAFKDAKVKQKKAYNSHPRNRQRGLISGDDWYSLQAYRAMNQVRRPRRAQ